jgi:hypothetical protein
MMSCSQFFVNSEGKLCRIINTSILINKYNLMAREPAVVQFFINGLKEDGKVLNFIYNRVYVNDKIGW